MDLEGARKLSGTKLASWRVRMRELCWGHTDHLIKEAEGQFVEISKKPRFDILEVIVLVLLVINMVVLGLFDPLAPHSVRSQVAQYTDLTLSALFLLEAIMRFLSFGHIVFISDKWNAIDLLIVILSFIAAIIEAAGISFGNFTILRTVRVFRPLRSVTTLPAAKTLVLSIYSAIQSLQDVTVLYILFIISFSIIGVTQFMGKLRTRCVRNEWMDFEANRTAFFETNPAYETFASNFTISDFVCGGMFEQLAPGVVQSIGCDLDATCNDAQFIGNRLLVGYTCPWGYKCLPIGNPMFGYASFDSVPQAMLTIFVGVTAEGLYRTAFQMMDAFDVTAAYYFVAINVFGTFFIVNLSIVLVTVTFEHVSCKIRDNHPQLVSKMQKALQSPRILRRNRGKSRIHVKTMDGEGRNLEGDIHEEHAWALAQPEDEDEAELQLKKKQGMMAEQELALLDEDETKLTSFGAVAERIMGAARASLEKKEAERERQRLEEELKREEERALLSEGGGSGGAEAVKNKIREKQQRIRGATFVMDGIEAQEKGGEDDGWSKAMDKAEAIKPMRDWVDRLLTRDNFENILNVLIVLNIAIMCTHHYPSNPFLDDFFFISNIVFACLFGLEFLIKVLHWGPKRYFTVPINIFDFFVLVLAIVDVSLQGLFPSVTALRAVRLLKVMKSFPGVLRWTVVILVSIKSSFLLLCTIFVVNYCFASFGLHMFGGLFCNLATKIDFRPDNTLSWCPNRPRANFDDVATALLTTFQLMTGDNWDIIMYNAMRSRSWFVALAFVSYVVLMTFVLVNILVGILLSGPSPQEVDLIGQKLFGISFEEKEREAEEEERQRAASVGTLEQWEEQVKNAQSGKSAAKIDLMAFAERTMSAVPRKFLDSLEAVENTILLSEHAMSVNNQRRSFKRFLKEGLSSRLVENMMLLLLLVSSVALAFETPESAPDDPRAIILRMLDYVFTVLFLIEIILNFYAFGIVKEADSYLRRDPWNVLDAILVLTNTFGTSMHFFFKARWLRILLVVRAVRPLRFVKRSQGLRTVFTAFAMSIVPLKNVIFLAVVIWTCWGLMGVQLFMGSFYTCTNTSFTTKASCLEPLNVTTGVFANNGSAIFKLLPSGNAWNNAPLHFDHLGASFLSLLTLATLDGGADIMINGIDSVGQDIAPIVNYRQRVSFFFVSFVFIGGYFLINLVVSVIIDTYNKEKLKNGDTGIFLTAGQNTFLRSHRRLLHGVPPIFYDDHDVKDWRRTMRQIVNQPWFKNVATFVSLINGCLLIADYYEAPQALRSSILICNFIFAIVFSCEVALKMASLGYQRYFHSRFNQFDLFVTVCVFVGVLLEVALPDRGYTFVFRAMRSISLFRVVRNAEKLRHVIARFSYSLYGLANVGALLFIFLYIFGVMGVKSFGLIKYQGSITRQNNFNNVFRAILLLLNSLAGGGWAENMSDCALDSPSCDMDINNCGVFGWSQAYFVLFIVLTKFVLLNMFIAVILDSFVSTDYEAVSISKEHVSEFFDKWFMLDPQQTLRIDSHQLVPFLRSLGPNNPLGFGGSELTRKIGQEFRFIQQLRLHEMDGTIELQDLITALCDATLGVPLPDSEIRALQKYADRKFHRKERELYIGKRNTEQSRRVIERFAVHVIENHWLDYRYRRRGKRVGVQSLLRSRAGENGDGMSRRDNLSYVDNDNQSLWGGGGDDSDDADNSDDYDEKGVLKPTSARAVAIREGPLGLGVDGERARTVLDMKDKHHLKSYMKKLAVPLIQAHEVRETEKLLQEAQVKGAKQLHVADETAELHRLLVPRESNQWHDEGQRRLEAHLAKKEPLGGRILHAERVMESFHRERKIQELQEAEQAFATASAETAADDDEFTRSLLPERHPHQHGGTTMTPYERDQHQQRGLIPQTSQWRRLQDMADGGGDGAALPASPSQHNNWARSSGAQRPHHPTPTSSSGGHDFHSPTSRAFQQTTNHPHSRIPGTYAAAAFAVSPTLSSPTAKSKQKQQRTSSSSSMHARALESGRSFFNNNDDDDDDDTEMTVESPTSLRTPRNMTAASPHHLAPSAEPATFDDLEVKILLQELKEWKGEEVKPEEKVTRPAGYHKKFSAVEYASL